MHDTERFLTALYGGLDDDLWFCVWRLVDKRAWFHQHVNAAATANEGGLDVFCGVGVTKRPPQRGRLSVELVDGIVGLVADIDIGGEHKPPDQDAAMALLADLPFPPTRLVHSGHGLHAWWLFKEPWTFGDAVEREEAAAVSEGWGKMVQAQAMAEEWTLDSVHDLARVMRLPGTLNTKYKPPREVTLFDAEGLHFNPNDFEQFKVPPERRAQNSSLHVKLDGAFPTLKHEAMLANSEAYRRTWEHQRLELRDSSLSTHDLSLCTYAVAADWTDAELAALIRLHRQKHGGPKDVEKGNRADYVALTVTKARSDKNDGQALAKATEALADPELLTREQKLENLAAKFAVPLTDIRRTIGTPAILQFVMADLTIQVPMEDIVTQSGWRKKIYALTGRVPRQVSSRERPGWDHYLNLIAEIAEPVDAGEEATEDGEVHSIVYGFLNERGIQTQPSGKRIEEPDLPFRRDGLVWFRAIDLCRYANQVGGVKVTQRALCHRLSLARLTRQTFAVMKASGDGSTTLSFWGIHDKDDDA